MVKKSREAISPEVAARILFLSDRICCVCRLRGKPVQIHHIDEDPSNNSLENLSVLCFDCHRETQIRGGFDRKLDSEQIILYRNDWHKLVAQRRANREAFREISNKGNSREIELATSIAEIYRENEEYEQLAIHYDILGNKELRDKYIELSIQKDPSDSTICFLRGIQERPDLIPDDVIERELDRYRENNDLLQRARFFIKFERHLEAAKDYVEGISKTLQENNVFSAAFYLKELCKEGIIEELFILALKKARDEGDLWWQVRTYQELGWRKELNEFLLRNRKQIEESEDNTLLMLLADASGNEDKSVELRKEMARNSKVMRSNDVENKD